MSKSYPDTIPEQFAADSLADAYRCGWNHGHGIACHNIPTIGARLWSESLGCIIVDAENIREVHADNCYSAESNSRQYSPFEFTAHEFNSADEYGWRVSYDHGDVSQELYATEDEARAAAVSEGWDASDIVECFDSESLWEAFEAGTNDAISADLAEYTDADYGIATEDAGQ